MEHLGITNGMLVASDGVIELAICLADVSLNGRAGRLLGLLNEITRLQKVDVTEVVVHDVNLFKKGGRNRQQRASHQHRARM